MADLTPAPIREKMTDENGLPNRVWVQWFTDNLKRMNERIQQVSSPTAGNIPIVDADGNLEDSGIATTYYEEYTDDAVAIKADTEDVLIKTNTTAYTPTADYHPATKVYADQFDRVSATQADLAAETAHSIADTGETVDRSDIEAKLDALGTEINKVNDLIDKLQTAGLMT